MIVTGYTLREAIKRWGLEAEAAGTLFADSMYRFEGETKDSPVNVMAALANANENIAVLQTAQAQYNIAVNVGSEDQPMSLCEAVKRIGGEQRLEKMWRSQLVQKSRRPWDLLGRRERDKGVEQAKNVMSQQEIVGKANEAAKKASRTRAAIATGNSTEMEISWLSPDLFT